MKGSKKRKHKYTRHNIVVDWGQVKYYLRRSHRATSEAPAVFLQCERGLLRLQLRLVATVLLSPQPPPSLARCPSIVERSHAKRHGRFQDQPLKVSRRLYSVKADGQVTENGFERKSLFRRCLFQGFVQGHGFVGILCDGDWYCVRVKEIFKRKQ